MKTHRNKAIAFSLALFIGCAHTDVVTVDFDNFSISHNGNAIDLNHLNDLATSPSAHSTRLVIHSGGTNTTLNLGEELGHFGLVEWALFGMLFNPPMIEQEVRDFTRQEAEREKRLDEERRAEIKPGVDFVLAFRQQNNRLPSQEQFRDWSTNNSEHLLDLVVDPQIIAMHGGQPGHDFGVGTWLSDWFYYYRSWDGTYTHRLNTQTQRTEQARGENGEPAPASQRPPEDHPSR